MAIYFFTEDTEMPKCNYSKLKSWIRTVVANKQRKVKNINFIFCSDIYLLEINKKYLNHNFYTDVITFDYSINNNTSGDAFISLDRVRDNIKQYQTNDTELLRVIIHAVLHLCGYKDDTETEINIIRQEEDAAIDLAINQFNLKCLIKNKSYEN